uniref:ZC3H15/TMA46 family C-terminal domain-containing protein n=1 Tax=Craspedostauros australis TaxID=1486917 RepID=A0A6T6H7B8_9STRA|mmetsp:Transcript_23520/g.65672  ORF Transcript_23520/g.65672 Transcript_23520/m.65672 type:complete len:269 (+) Transcript_23520:227-1033(+)|eukprot:CAMPEP_0198134466 /NCGR_PEP_ID=MMETSP1442-20131203/60093_1 /TAXON_ID= /ORGANISM="Craspedostauros australis, Strain CCMP3328" /LENGTH=268 /DNA_ID=CAMNT_0043795611 /DNA_START=256 /DNA_END=1062 /DNA_ORIENTATION=-
MPAKAKKGGNASKKTEQKKKNKIIEDRTFGLKNKNKSKKVQQHIQSVTKQVMSVDRRTRMEEEKRKQMRKDHKLRKKAEEAERNALFGEALLAVKKKKTTNQKDGKQEAKGRDGNDESAKKGTSRAMKMMYQMDAQEMEDRLKEDPNYVPTLEDEIESERQKKVAELKKSGQGTKVTPESFAAWKEKKRKRRAEEARKKVEAEFKKKKGGKGLAILSGRDLFEYKRELFDKDLEDGAADKQVDDVAAKVQSDLFLEGDDDDLDDLDDD